GNYKLNQVRKALDICVGKKHSFTSDYLNANVLPKNNEIKLISNNQWYKLARDIASGNLLEL
ncbi:MAG: phytanoyl-CoA dioxygenase, partial [Cyanobacteria bacterium J06642_3]